MAYLDNILGHGEEKLYLAHRHIIFLLSRVALRALVAAALLVIGILLKIRVQNMGGTILLLIFLAAALVFIAQLAVLTLQWRNEMYVITQHRVIQIEGIFGKHTEDSSLNMINDLVLNQSLWGRLFHFGDLQVVTGNDLGDTLRGIADPFAFKRALLAAREQAAMPTQQMPAAWQQPAPEPPYVETAPRMPQHTASFATASQSAEEITTLIARLADLRDRGAISQQEFDEKRTELLRRI